MDNHDLYRKQKRLLDTFLEHGAIDQKQYDKSLGDLKAKMKIVDPEDLKKRGITQRYWLWHLDEMTDEEITYMLDHEPDAAEIAEERKAQPDISDRTRAELLRAF